MILKIHNCHSFLWQVLFYLFSFNFNSILLHLLVFLLLNFWSDDFNFVYFLLISMISVLLFQVCLNFGFYVELLLMWFKVLIINIDRFENRLDALALLAWVMDMDRVRSDSVSAPNNAL